MRVLVTGATGFAGPHLIRTLSEHGAQVTAVSRKTKPAPPWADRHESINISPRTSWGSLLKDTDAVVHLADGLNAFEHLPAHFQDDKSSERVEATLNLVRSAIASGVPKFIYLSSIKAMAGTWAPGVLTEKTTAHPTSLYGRLKLETEQKIMSIAEGSSTSAFALRFPVVFGPNAGGNISRLLRLVDTAWPLPFAGIENARSMISLNGMTDAITAVINNQDREGGVFLVHDAAISLPNLIAHLQSGLGRPDRMFRIPSIIWPTIEYIPKIGDIVSRFTRSLEFSDSKFRERFSWKPSSDMSDELYDTALAYKRSSTLQK